MGNGKNPTDFPEIRISPEIPRKEFAGDPFPDSSETQTSQQTEIFHVSIPFTKPSFGAPVHFCVSPWHGIRHVILD